MAKEVLVVEELLGTIAKHQIQLQRVANKLEGAVANEFRKLANELDGISREFDATKPMSGAKRRMAQSKIIKRGQDAIKRSNQVMASMVRDNLIDVGNLETKFSVGSINQAVTGKGTIKFATETVPAKKISKMADNLIIRGASQKQLYSRQASALGNKFKDVIRQGWLANESIGTISQNIRGTASAGFRDGIMKVSRNHANSLARTSISSISNQVREETYIANSDVVEGVQFIAFLDDRTTPICQGMNSSRWKWIDSMGWKSLDGRDYKQPPLHFNCRSTLIPMVFPADVLAKTVPAKLALVPKDRKRGLGKPLPKTIKGKPTVHTDFDVWLHAQPLATQQDIMGKAHSLWIAGKISARRLVTQKGRVRTTDELYNIYTADELIPKEIAALKSGDSFKVNKLADAEHQAILKNTSKKEFLDIEERLILGKSVTKEEIKKLNAILNSADTSDLLYDVGFNVDNFAELLGSRAKRLAFYNHTAKRFSMKSAKGGDDTLRKGDLYRRNIGELNRVDEAVLLQLREKIISDTVMTSTNKQILLEMFEEASQIVGTQRSLPMIESLFTLARRNKFSGVKGFDDIDEVVGYLNNSLRNSVNSYFARAKNLEIKITSSSEKATRYLTLSEQAKKIQYTELTSPKIAGERVTEVSLAEANQVKKNIKKIGERSLRDFDGNELTSLTVDMELSVRENISLYLKYLSDDVRMSDNEIVKFMKRVSEQPRMTKAQKLHLQRVEFIVERVGAGQVKLTDAIMRNEKLFKGWFDASWTRKGLAKDIRKEVGEVLADAQLYKNLQKYLEFKNPYGEVFEDVLRESRRLSTRKIDDKINALVTKNAKERKKVILEREKKVKDSLNKDGELDKAIRAGGKADDSVALDLKRLEADDAVITAYETKYQAKIIKNIDDLVESNIKNKKNPFYEQALVVKGDDPIKLADLIDSQLFSAIGKGEMYVQSSLKLGKKYYQKFKGGSVGIDEDDLIKMGHFLIESAVKSKIVKRSKTWTEITSHGKKYKRVVWMLRESTPEWKQAFLANKRHYGLDVDGLPSIGKAPQLKDGFYSNGSPAIRGVDDVWLKEQASKTSSKPWIDNLNTEASTGIRVNNYIFNVMEELESKGKSIIPKKPTKASLKSSDAKELDEAIKARSKYDSYVRAKEMSRGLQDETFYNRMSNDKFARTYADTTALQWQGDDINRGLMMFDRGAKMGTTGEADFARNFMNLAGFDKLPMKTRIKLFKQIDEEILLKTIDDPIKNDWWYTKTDWEKTGIVKDMKVFSQVEKNQIRELIVSNPEKEGAFQFLAMVKERSDMIHWTRSGNKIEDFISHIPSQRDGTTNVLQHFAAISKEKKVAQAVNMVYDQAEDVVKDAYIQYRNAVDEIAEAMSSDNPIRQLILIDDNLSHAARRKSVKTGLMTTQYNAGAETIGKSYRSAMLKENNYAKLVDASDADIKKLGAALIQKANDLYPEAYRVRKAFNAMAEAHEVAAYEGVSGAHAIEVKTTMGFPFKQSYTKTQTRRLELNNSDGTKMKLDVRVELDPTDFDNVDWSAQRRAFAPNIIHAMDATHKSLVVEALKKAGIKDFSMIHDSFGTNFGQMDLLSKATKQTFLEMYKDKNFIEFLVKNFEDNNVPMRRYLRNDKGSRVKGNDGRWMTEDITGENWDELFSVKGDYNFEDFMELEYFFH